MFITEDGLHIMQNHNWEREREKQKKGQIHLLKATNSASLIFIPPTENATWVSGATFALLPISLSSSSALSKPRTKFSKEKYLLRTLKETKSRKKSGDSLNR